jgi:phenolic acid decarboxylase
MAKNSSSGGCTRHVDTRYHFVREHIVDEFIKVVFVKSCKNDADVFTKSVIKDAYTKHVSNFLGKMEDSNG